MFRLCRLGGPKRAGLIGDTCQGRTLLPSFRAPFTHAHVTGTGGRGSAHGHRWLNLTQQQKGSSPRSGGWLVITQRNIIVSHKSVDQTESLMSRSAGSLKSHGEFLPQRGQCLKWQRPSRGSPSTRKTSVLIARFWIRVEVRRLVIAR